jgi:glucokinase
VTTAVAIDIGGSGIRAATVGPTGVIGDVARWPLSHDISGSSLVVHMRDIIERSDADVIGVALPGFVNGEGRIIDTLNLPHISGVDLHAELETVASGRPVRSVQDIAGATLAESLLGTGAGADRFLCVTLGTGANAGLAVGGELVETAWGALGDAGHVCVDPAGPPCTCGGIGCLEAFASGVALAREGAVAGLGSARDVLQAAKRGDATAVDLVGRAGTALGRAIAIWSALVFPERVALVGGLAIVSDILIPAARAELERMAPQHAVANLELVTGALGVDATVIGAGLIALQALEGAAL